MSLDISSISGWAGWAGMALIILAYFLLSIKKLKPHSIIYNLLNLFGGVALILNTVMTKSWPSVALNALWAIIAFFSIFKIRTTRSGYREIKG